MKRSELIRKYGRLAEASHAQAQNTVRAPLVLRDDHRLATALESTFRQMIIDLSELETD